MPQALLVATDPNYAIAQETRIPGVLPAPPFAPTNFTAG